MNAVGHSPFPFINVGRAKGQGKWFHHCAVDSSVCYLVWHATVPSPHQQPAFVFLALLRYHRPSDKACATAVLFPF